MSHDSTVFYIAVIIALCNHQHWCAVVENYCRINLLMESLMRYIVMNKQLIHKFPVENQCSCCGAMPSFFAVDLCFLSVMFCLYFQVIIHASGYSVMGISRATMNGSHLAV